MCISPPLELLNGPHSMCFGTNDPASDNMNRINHGGSLHAGRYSQFLSGRYPFTGLVTSIPRLCISLSTCWFTRRCGRTTWAGSAMEEHSRLGAIPDSHWTATVSPLSLLVENKFPQLLIGPAFIFSQFLLAEHNLSEAVLRQGFNVFR